MKKIIIGFLGIVLATAVIGCSTDDTNEENSKDSEPINENDTNQEKGLNEGQEEDSENESNQELDQNENDENHLSLGETGTVESVVGDYEVTVNSFEYMDEIEGESSNKEFFIVVDYTVKNIGTEKINGEDIYGADLFDENGSRGGNISFFESVNMLEGTIDVNEAKSGELLFDGRESEYYDLVFNFGALESNATRLTWRLNADEASN
ncbi:DUF4352 domain-containing protein [Gracilibacillus saliphilus]|uniref:DUF4352 domain-containing protein n=1 Tax=Gracilibacillus saliphilus TaxID=543890 RepID=UPI0013D5E4AB|nr:DUF4352 domain-containing protein [Gracilibacillus saliphilus]